MIIFINKHKFYLLLGLLFVIANSLLFLLAKPAVAMELFYYPWLVQKGFVMYRDFFHNHGPLLNYVLAPLTLDKSLTSLKVFYVFIQNINLILVLVMVKKFSKISGFVIGGIIFIIFNYIFAYPYFWDEQIIATFFLLIYYVLDKEDFSLKPALLGIMIGLLGLIKPNVVAVVIPIFFLYKRRSYLLYPIIIWIITAVYFAIQGAFPKIIGNIISFNFFYQNFSRNSYPYLSEIKSMMFFLNFLLIISIFSVFSINRKNINIILIIFLLFSTITFYPELGYQRLVPFGSFLAIFIAYLFTITKKKLFLSTILLLHIIGFLFQVKSIIRNQINLPSIAENVRNQKIINYLSTSNLYQKKFYVMSNNPEIYYFLDRPIKLYFPLMYPSISGFYKNYQQTYINDLEKNNITLIIIPQPLSVIYAQATGLTAFVRDNYTLYYQDEDFLVYSKKQ